VRSRGSEILSVAAILSMPLGIAAIFPFEAFRFRANEGDCIPARTAFVQMSPDSEFKALRAVRASWREKVGVRWQRADLFSAELPEDELRSVLSIRDRSRPPAPPPVLRDRMPFLPSQKAPPPVSITARAVDEPPAFPRAELLRMN